MTPATLSYCNSTPPPPHENTHTVYTHEKHTHMLTHTANQSHFMTEPSQKCARLRGLGLVSVSVRVLGLDMIPDRPAAHFHIFMVKLRERTMTTPLEKTSIKTASHRFKTDFIVSTKWMINDDYGLRGNILTFTNVLFGILTQNWTPHMEKDDSQSLMLHELSSF